MPIYEYLCKTCKKEFELLRPMSATDLPPCPDCGGGEVARRLSLFLKNTPGVKSGGGGGSCCSGGGCTCH
jgi:putative FmdB family regulatory protein